MTFRSAVVTTHRWLGLFAALLWLLQAVTGVLIVFHWEIDDAITPGVHHPTDWRVIEDRVREWNPSSIWTTAGKPDRYDVNVPARTVRIDGAGNELRVRRDGEKFANGGIVDTVVVLHQSLLSGPTGAVIIGVSGMFLLSNLLLGVIAAWPRPGQWKRALAPLSSGSRIARLYSWHRAAGLWLVLPAFCTVSAGVLLAFDETTSRVFHADVAEPVQPATAPLRIGLARAIDIALARYPGSLVSGIAFPSHDNAIWALTLKQPGELQRAYGKTRIFVSAIDGRLLGEVDALHVRRSHRFADLLFPIHTGEVAGVVGRLIVLTMGLWLAVMIVLGASLWRARRIARLDSFNRFGRPRQ